MCYGVLYRMTITGAVCGAATSVILAALGFGFVALAWSMLANVVGTFFVSIWHWPRHFGYRFSLKYWRVIGAFGVYSMAGNMLQELAGRSEPLHSAPRLNLSSRNGPPID